MNSQISDPGYKINKLYGQEIHFLGYGLPGHILIYNLENHFLGNIFSGGKWFSFYTSTLH